MTKNLCKSCDGSGKITYTAFNKIEKCNWCDGSRFNILGTDNIVCPYCDFENDESYEWNNDEEYTCYNCNKKSLLQVNISVDYTTTKAECLNDELKHDFKVHDYMPIRDNGDKFHTCRICRKEKWMKESDIKSE